MAISTQEVAALRASLGLPPDPYSDSVWASRSWATTADVLPRLQEKASTTTTTTATPTTTTTAPTTNTSGRPAGGVPSGTGSGGDVFTTGQDGNANYGPVNAGTVTAGAEDRAAEREAERHAARLGAALFDSLGLPEVLLQVFIDSYLEFGDQTLALVQVRKDPQYETYFPGNKRDDGTLRYSEAEYTSNKEGVQERLAEYGFSPDAINFGQLLKNGGDFEEAAFAAREAATRFTEPGMGPTALAQQYLSAFSSTGSNFAALDQVRDSAAYGNVFAGNIRDDGSLRMDEPDYFAYKRGWQRTLLSRGLDPREFEARGLFEQTVESEQSIQEVDQRLQLVQDGIIDQLPAYMEFYAQNYGLDVTPEAILGMAIDPDIENDVLQRRVQASQIGGEARLQGFARSVDRAEELARAGLTGQSARGLYSSAGQNLAGISAATARANRGETDLTQFEGAFGLERAEDRTRIQRSLQEDASTFSSRSDTRRSRDGFGISGLRQR